MKNFNELFAGAAIISDCRKQVFNQLIEKTKSEILPKFCEACEGFDIRTVFFKTQNRIFKDQVAHELGENYFVYCLAIEVAEKTISDSNYFYSNNSFSSTSENTPINEVAFLRTGIVDLVHSLNSRLEDYVQRYADKNRVASKF